jgi:4-hydroxybenzoate polyprenyltransferase
MEGDALKGRTTVPLLMGSESSRWTLAVTLVFWSAVCPYYLGLSTYSYILPMALGTFTGLNFVRNTDNVSDKKSFHLYCVWVSVMLQLPAIKLI